MNDPPNVTCPDAATLAAYARDDLPSSDESSLDRHLTGCRRCRERYLADLGRQLLVPAVPDCRVVKEIGRGRFGVVYKAWWLSGEPRVVALKVLSTVGDMERGRFEREIAVLRHLDAPGIVKCLAAGGSGDSAYFIMDYVEGVHFDEFVKSEAVSRNEKLAVFERVCRTVALAHEHGVVHRDLKPRNIIIDGDRQPHVLDFGICSVDSVDRSSWALGTLTHPGDVIGTLRYMSPEQAWGGVVGAIDERSDIWSLGIMLYELVTDGGYPYSLEPAPEKSAHESLLERIRKETPTLPKLEAVSGGRDMRLLLERCLTWEPQHRIASAADLASDVAALQRGRPVRTRPLSMGYRFKRLAVGAATRSRWTFATSFVAAIMFTLSIASMLGAISWHEPVLPRHAKAQSTDGPIATANVRDGIVVAGISDESVKAIQRTAVDLGIEGVTSDTRTWRPVHARMLHRLIDARPKAVVWDYYFSSDQPSDRVFAESIAALQHKGIPVVLATESYDESGRPRLATVLTESLGSSLRHGAINTQSLALRSGEFVVAIQRENGRVFPSLWLTTLAAVLHPEARVEIDWPHRTQPLTLMYAVGPGLYLRERDHIMPSRSFQTTRTAEALGGGEMLAVMQTDFDDPRAWQDRTIRYEDLLRVSADQLSDWTIGRVLLIGDMRETGLAIVDRHDVEFRGAMLRNVPGCHLVAEAIAGLMSAEYVRTPFPLPPGLATLVIAMAIVGCLLPIRIASWRVLEGVRTRRSAYALLAIMSAASLAVLLGTSSSRWVWTSVGALSITAAMIGSFWVEFARNRHRVAERQRRTIENFGFGSAGTLTLPRTPLTSIPGIR